MELLLAKQSIQIKCRIQSSVLLGNYEFYYAGGLLCRLAGKIPPHDIQPEDFYAFLEPLFVSYEPKNQQEAYLLCLLKNYTASTEYDTQMSQLMQMGLREKDANDFAQQ